MKFGKYLKENQPEAWKQQCINYQALKDILKQLIKAQTEESKSGSKDSHRDRDGSKSPRRIGSTVSMSRDYSYLLAPVLPGTERVSNLPALYDVDEKKETESETTRLNAYASACQAVCADKLRMQMPMHFDSDEVHVAEVQFVTLLCSEVEKASTFYADRCGFFADRVSIFFALLCFFAPYACIRISCDAHRRTICSSWWRDWSTLAT